MDQLARPLQAPDSPNWLAIAELRQEIGDFSAAADTLRRIDSRHEKLRSVIDRLLSSKVQGPVRYYL